MVNLEKVIVFRCSKCKFIQQTFKQSTNGSGRMQESAKCINCKHNNSLKKVMLGIAGIW
ncbi:MAG: hypothetical protein AABY22_23720 [Nanoarchaeota archaeon]